MLRILMMVPCLALLGGCARSTSALEPVSGFELERYSGRWFEIARLPHRFERHLVAVTADYTVLDDGSVRVHNRGYHTKRQEWTSITGRARFRGNADVGLLSVRFFWPFSGTYKIIRLDEDYTHAVVTSSTYDYFWILSRTPTMNKAVLDELIAFAKTSGFDTAAFEFPDQTMNLPTQ
jgi:apolipoprotein D and lipocalin family protein